MAEQSLHQLQELKEAPGTQELSIQTHTSPFTQACAMPQLPSVPGCPWPLRALCNKPNGGSQNVGPGPRPTHVNASFFRAMGRKEQGLGHGALGAQKKKPCFQLPCGGHGLPAQPWDLSTASGLRKWGQWGPHPRAGCRDYDAGREQNKRRSVRQPCKFPLPQAPLRWQQKDKDEGAQGRGEGKESSTGGTDPLWPGRVTGQGQSRGSCGKSRPREGREGVSVPRPQPMTRNQWRSQVSRSQAAPSQGSREDRSGLIQLSLHLQRPGLCLCLPTAFSPVSFLSLVRTP